MVTRIGRSFLMVLALLLAAVPAAGAYTASPAVPSNLSVPQQNVLLLTAFATGVQVYVCKARPDDPNTFVWTFKAPEAELWNDAGEKIGTHSAGPVWESSDGSKVQGKVLERADAPTPSAIPWLLLEATPLAGSGVLSDVTYIQRLDTVGGIAPADGCDLDTANTERGVPYTAVYAFYHAYGAEM